MVCVSPPELDDRELLAYLDHTCGLEVVEHLKRCPHCHERARRLAQFRDRLAARLYRTECPSPIELGEYHLGMLPGEQAEAVSRHLNECPHCRREVDQLQAYLADLEPSLQPSPLEQIKERVRVLIAHLVDEAKSHAPGMPTPAPAHAGLRGEEEARVYVVGDVQIAIEVQDDAKRPGRKTLLGLVIGAEPEGVQARLWQDERRIATIPVDELGNFVIPDLAAGSYELIVGGPEVEVHVQNLQVGK
jgi:hypothetical protein